MMGLCISIFLDSQGEDGLDELVTVMMTPKTGRRLQVPEVHVLSVQVCQKQQQANSSNNCIPLSLICQS